MRIQPTTLIGSSIQLEPLSQSHYQELYNAAQDKTIWIYSSSKATGDQFKQWFGKAIRRSELKEQLPFVVRRLSDSKVLGSTRYYDINLAHQRVTIGYTWYVPETWGSRVNPECKLLLLTFAFEELKLNRVEFVVDSRNLRSRAAVKKLGATEEGVLRQHRVLDDGYIRDSVIFSIIQTEWPPIKLGLIKRLGT